MAIAMCGGVAGRPPAASERHQGEQQRKAQVLEQADRHGEAAVRAVVLRLLGELRDDDGRRGHRDRAADDDRDRRGDAETRTIAQGRDDRRGQHDLAAADAEHLVAHRDQARQREFEAQREHQKHHAEVREQRVVSLSAASASACGPSSMPTAR
jgi:hypothetical protein